MCFTFCSNDVIGSQSKCHGDCDWCDLIGYSVENKMGLGFSSSRLMFTLSFCKLSLLFQIDDQNDNSEEQCSQNSDKILIGILGFYAVIPSLLPQDCSSVEL